MKKYLSVLFVLIIFMATQGCSSSDAPSPNALIKGKWIETKTTSTGKVTKGLPLQLQILFPGGVLPSSVLDTIKIIRTLNFLNDKEVEITTSATTQATTKSNWKFTNGTSSIEFSNINLGSDLLGSINTLNADIKKLTATELSIASNLKLTNVEFNASALGLGILRLDVDLNTMIDMKK